MKTVGAGNLVILLSMVGMFVVIGYVAATSLASSSQLSGDGSVSGDLVVVATPGEGVKAEIDGVGVPVGRDGSINTALLPNGNHSLKVTDSKLGSVSTVRNIDVYNPLNFIQALRNDLYLPLRANEAGADAVLAGATMLFIGASGSLYYLFWRRRLKL